MTEAIYEFFYEALSMKAVGIVLGLALIVSHVFALLQGEKVKGFLKTFPRHKKAGMVLIIIDAAIAYVLMREIDMGEFFKMRGKILFLIPVSAFLVIRYADEFLAVRALGTLMLLASGPVLASAFLQPQVTRLLLPVLAYAWILVGLFWVGMPYLMRDQVGWVTEKAGRWKGACFAGAGYGALLLVLAVATY